MVCMNASCALAVLLLVHLIGGIKKNISVRLSCCIPTAGWSIVVINMVKSAERGCKIRCLCIDVILSWIAQRLVQRDSSQERLSNELKCSCQQSRSIFCSYLNKMCLFLSCFVAIVNWRCFCVKKNTRHTSYFHSYQKVKTWLKGTYQLILWRCRSKDNYWHRLL